MPLVRKQKELARDLAATLTFEPLSARPLRSVVAQLPALLAADSACAFLVRERNLEFFHGANMPAGIRPAYARWLLSAPPRFANYDPDAPDRRQRNVVLRTHEIRALVNRGAPPVVSKFLPRFAISECAQMRVLVCDGPLLLAWAGVLRVGKFSREDVRLFQTLVVPLQRRLAIERRLGEAQARAIDLGVAVEEVPAAVFVLGARGSVLHANAAGRALLDQDRTAVEAQLATGLGVRSANIDADLRLAVVQRPADPAPRVAAARIRWHLTPRQSQVLRHLASGLSNRAIAAELACAESTVELHVTALLEKSLCESRAQLVARLWSGG
ncbi:MAG TPA: LuxR C-terminal-related transcriptional regulator [Myxococcales bacterium]